MEKRIAVIGVGNPLCGDDGLGVFTAYQLQNESLPKQVKVLDGGTAGLDLLYLFEEADFVLIIDCLDAGDEPGAIYRVPWESLAGGGNGGEAVSLHDFNLFAVLSLADKLGKLPQAVIFGVQPENTEFGAPLSPIVMRAIPLLIEKIKQEIRNVYSITQ